MAFELLDCIDDNPWIDLSDRNLYKKPIMSYAYSMGSQGRIAHYIEHLTDNAYERGISQINLNSVIKLSNIIDRYFVVFETKYLKDGNKFLSIIKGYINHFCNDKKPIYIHNSFVSWVFCPYKTIMERIRLIIKHQLSLYTNTGQIDYNKAITSFSSIFIHSIDAHIVFLFRTMVKDIEKDLRKKGIKFNIGVFTNHDNFGIILALAIYLKIILKDNYNSISTLEYIKQLNNPITKKFSLKS